jgi:hypothetical protein
VHVSVKVALALNAPVLCVPESAFVPLHAPDAVQEVARVLDQLNVLAPPELTELGLAESVTVGPCQYWASAGVATMLASASSANRIGFFMAAIISKRCR